MKCKTCKADLADQDSSFTYDTKQPRWQSTQWKSVIKCEQEYLSLSTRVRKGGRGDLGDVDRRRVQRRSQIPAVADCRSKRDRYPSRCFCIEPSRRSARWNATSSDRFRRSSCSCRTVHRHPRFPELDSRLGISYVAQWFLATRSLLQPGSETASSLGRARETSPCPRSVPDWFRS